MRKKGLAAGMILLLCLPGSIFALAEDVGNLPRHSMMLSGTVEPSHTVAVMAPFGGVLQDSALAAGDIVRVGDVLHTIQTTAVYAPFDGTVGALGLAPGDDVLKAQERYTALLYIEPTSPFVISATTGSAYSRPENFIIHVGETVYLRSTSTRNRSGEGFITSVDGRNYTVEVTGGNLKLSEKVNIYRGSDYNRTTRLGVGTTERSANVAITAEEGTVYRIHVKQGDAVKRGDLLLELVTGAISGQSIPDSAIKAETDGVVASVDVTAGETVAQNQLLATLYPFEGFQVAVPVSESDLPYIALGDAVRIELSGMWPEPFLEGTVADISGLNTGSSAEEDADATYTVYIDFPHNQDIRQGMNVDVYFNEDS
jgi:multidrug efflux pump subunit AcrA (membrane-fusion protein)